MSDQTVSIILGGILALGTIFAGGYIIKIKAVLIEAKDVLVAVYNVIDDKATPEEIAVLRGEVKEFLNSIKAFK
jgi:hypothetical protein